MEVTLPSIAVSLEDEAELWLLESTSSEDDREEMAESVLLPPFLVAVVVSNEVGLRSLDLVRFRCRFRRRRERSMFAFAEFGVGVMPVVVGPALYLERRALTLATNVSKVVRSLRRRMLPWLVSSQAPHATSTSMPRPALHKYSVVHRFMHGHLRAAPVKTTGRDG